MPTLISLPNLPWFSWTPWPQTRRWVPCAPAHTQKAPASSTGTRSLTMPLGTGLQNQPSTFWGQSSVARGVSACFDAGPWRVFCKSTRQRYKVQQISFTKTWGKTAGCAHCSFRGGGGWTTVPSQRTTLTAQSHLTNFTGSDGGGSLP